MKAFFQLYLAALKEFARDRMTVFWTIAFPLVFIFLFGVIFGSNSDPRFDVGLVMEDRGAASAQLAQVLKQVPVFNITEGTRDAELAALKKGDRRAVIILPQGLSDAVAQKQSAPVQVFYDPANQQSSQIVLGITREIVEQTDRRLSGVPSTLIIAEQTIQAQSLRSIDFLLPGILAMALMQLGLFGTAQPMVQLRDQGVLRRLAATPLPRRTFLASQVGLRLTIALLQTVVIVGVGYFVFNVPMDGSWLMLVGLVVLGALMFIALGYVVAAFSKNQESAAGISSMLSFPLMFLSGLFFPVELMPAFLRPIVALIPLTYLVDAIRQVMVESNPLHPLPVDVAVMGAWLAGGLMVAVRFFKWE